MGRLQFTIGCFFALFATEFFCNAARAASFYLESLTGVGMIQGTPTTTRFGFAAGFPIFASFAAKGNDAFEIQAGIYPRFLSASDTSGAYTLTSIYPALRIQLSRVFVGGGATLFSWEQSPSEAFSLKPSTLAYFGEAGLLWPLIPTFSLGVSGTLSYITASGATIYGPVYDVMAIMRFYLGSIGEERGSRSSNEFQGWRYPFGRLR